MCSHEVPDQFSTCSSSSQCVLQHVPYSSSLDPMSFDLSSTLEIYITSQKEEIRTYLFWASQSFIIFFVMGQNTHHKRKINKLGVTTTNQYESWLIIYSMPIIIGTYGNELLPKFFLIKKFPIFKFEWLLKFEQCSIVTWEVCGYWMWRVFNLCLLCLIIMHKKWHLKPLYKIYNLGLCFLFESIYM